MLPWLKKPPSLAEFMREEGDDDDAPMPKQTAADQFRIALEWNAALGGKVVYRDTP